jgi:hypothetical protein
MRQRVPVNCTVFGGEPPPREGRIGASARGGRIGASARAVIVVPHGELRRLTHRMRPHPGIGRGSPLGLAAAGADRLAGTAVLARDTPGTASHARAGSAGDDERLAAPAESAQEPADLPGPASEWLSTQQASELPHRDRRSENTHHSPLFARRAVIPWPSQSRTAGVSIWPVQHGLIARQQLPTTPCSPPHPNDHSPASPVTPAALGWDKIAEQYRILPRTAAPHRQSPLPGHRPAPSVDCDQL